MILGDVKDAPGFPIGDAARYIRVNRAWCEFFIPSIYESLHPSHLFRNERTILLETLASRPHLAALVEKLYINEAPPFRYFKTILQECQMLQELRLIVLWHEHHSRVAQGSSSSPPNDHAETPISAPNVTYDSGVGPASLKLLEPLPYLRRFRLYRVAQVFDMASLTSIISALPPTLAELDLESPFEPSLADADDEDTAECWTRVLAFVPKLVKLHVQLRATGLAHAVFPSTLQHLELSRALLSDYLPVLGRFADSTWIPSLRELPAISILDEARISHCSGDMCLDAALATPLRTELQALIEAGLAELAKRDHMGWTQEAEERLRDLPRAGWDLLRALIGSSGDDDHIDAFVDAYGFQWQPDLFDT